MQVNDANCSEIKIHAPRSKGILGHATDRFSAQNDHIGYSKGELELSWRHPEKKLRSPPAQPAQDVGRLRLRRNFALVVRVLEHLVAFHARFVVDERCVIFVAFFL